MNSGFITWGVVLVLLLALTGCRIDFEAQSLVRDDGSIERSTIFRAQEETDKNEIMTTYEIPAGGSWSQSVMTVIDPEKPQEVVEKTVPAYSAKRVVRPAQQPGQDFKRFSQAHDKSAVNQFSVAVRDYFFIKWFEYREQFKDIIDRENIENILSQLMDQALAQFRQQLGSGISDAAVLDQIDAILRTKYQPLVAALAQQIKKGGLVSKGVEEAAAGLDNLFDAPATYELLAANISGFDTPVNKELVEKSFQATEELLSVKFDSVKESVFGIHGPALFQKYNFQVKVIMPGVVLQTNAPRREGNALLWEFDSNRFDQLLTAQSRRFYPLRVLLVLVLLAGAGVVWQKLFNRG